MNIRLNDKPIDVADALTLEQLLQQQNLLRSGAALAVNHTIIPRALWPQHALHDGDDILLFQAIAGG